MSMFYALVAICFCGSALAQVPSRGACPPVKLQPNFDAKRWVGKWYEAERFYATFELDSSCNSYFSTADDNGNVIMTLQLYSNLSKCEEVFQRPLTVPDCEEPAKMELQMPNMPAHAISNLMVVGTDYDNYSVVFSCVEYGELNLQFAWIVTRDPNPCKEVMEEAYKVVAKNKINKKNFFKTNNTGCESEEEE